MNNLLRNKYTLMLLLLLLLYITLIKYSTLVGFIRVRVGDLVSVLPFADANQVKHLFLSFRTERVCVKPVMKHIIPRIEILNIHVL